MEETNKAFLRRINIWSADQTFVNLTVDDFVRLIGLAERGPKEKEALSTILKEVGKIRAINNGLQEMLGMGFRPDKLPSPNAIAKAAYDLYGQD